ncbi:hypothetical protein J1N35_010389 [Gossypium stocksii]|uniref:Uncharacterized protein n=1 Tax=Gossypium stocksii TaxID=47602 RepID=A0A9D4ACN4_9ROSI|nr:hypothetical protein J1N35_010389 [Gossypium stocksii]
MLIPESKHSPPQYLNHSLNPKLCPCCRDQRLDDAEIMYEAPLFGSPINPNSSLSFCYSSPSASFLVQVRHVSSRERAKRRKPMTPRTSKLKKIKMKSYSSYKSRFRTMNDGNIRRWREGKNHNAHLKSKKSRRRLRQPAIVPAAYAKFTQVFKRGEAYWWVEEIKEHNESGELAKLLKGFPIIHPGIACQGLCRAPTLLDAQKVVEENYGRLRSRPHCNENELIR